MWGGDVASEKVATVVCMIYKEIKERKKKWRRAEGESKVIHNSSARGKTHWKCMGVFVNKRINMRIVILLKGCHLTVSLAL